MRQRGRLAGEIGVGLDAPPMAATLTAQWELVSRGFNRIMTQGNAISGLGNGNGHRSMLRRCADGAAAMVRFVPFARDAAMDRLRRTGAKAFVRDLPMLMRMGFNYYRWVRPGMTGEDREAPPPMLPYDAWQAVNRWTPGQEASLRQRLADCQGALPKISVLMPVHDPPLEFLEAAIKSVVGQVYGDWELCIADDKSARDEVRAALSEWARRDARIKVTFCANHGHISRATNAAAELAGGDFLLFLDHDDELTPDALGEVALYVAENPASDFVYSDSDKVDVQGKRYDAEFKPDFSPELLLSYMYFTHLCAVRRELFIAVGGTRAGFEGSQDYDLALRATERARHVGHIPLVLYHWRAVPGSTATNGAAKPDSFAAGRNAVQEALDRRGMEGKALQPDWAAAGGLGIFAAEFGDDGPSVSILIPTRNRVELLKRCLKSLEKTTYRNFKVVIIDNESDDADTLKFLGNTSHRVVRVETGGKFSFAAINNRAAEAVDSEFILLLNNDTEVVDGRWLSRMMGYARAPGVGAVGARLVFPDGRVQHSGIVHGLHHGLAGHAFKLSAGWDNGYLSQARLTRNYSAVTAACLLTPRKLYLDQGGLDEKTFAVAYNDVDYCYRLAERGLRCVCVASAELIHYEGLSRGFADDPREVAAYRAKYGKRVDPYYSPHLSLEEEKFRMTPRRLARGPVRKLRVCVFSHFLNFTGAPLIQYELAAALMRSGVIEPVVACVPDGPLKQWYEKLGIEVHVLGENPLAPALARPEAYEPSIDALGRRMKEEWKVDVVWANTLDTVFAVDAASRTGLPVVWNIHESEGWRAYFGRYGFTVAQKCLECFAKPYRVIFGSDATRQAYASWNTAHNFISLRNPLDPGRVNAGASAWTRHSARQSLGVGESDLVILTVGSICQRKGQMDLVGALAKLPWWLRARVRVFFVGDKTEPYLHQLQSAIKGLEGDLPSRVAIAEETADVARYYRAADLFVCSSRIECYPRVTQEAMAFGLPLITTPVYGLAEQVRDGSCGVHYRPGSVDALAEAIVKLATDDEMRRRMAEDAPLVLAGLGGFERTVEQFGEILREAYLAGV
jgi:GT2 family glycosyltransferase